MADVVIVTSDNPRPKTRRRLFTIFTWAFHPINAVQIVPDRRRAIFGAVTQAKRSDIILLAGKGHETYQVIGTQKIDFSDVQVAREAMELL